MDHKPLIWNIQKGTWRYITKDTATLWYDPGAPTWIPLSGDRHAFKSIPVYWTVHSVMLWKKTVTMHVNVIRASCHVFLGQWFSNFFSFRAPLYNYSEFSSTLVENHCLSLLQWFSSVVLPLLQQPGGSALRASWGMQSLTGKWLQLSDKPNRGNSTCPLLSQRSCRCGWLVWSCRLLLQRHVWQFCLAVAQKHQDLSMYCPYFFRLPHCCCYCHCHHCCHCH